MRPTRAERTTVSTLRDFERLPCGAIRQRGSSAALLVQLTLPSGRTKTAAAPASPYRSVNFPVGSDK